MSAIPPETVAAHGLTAVEYERVRGILGRHPNLTELGIFSVMWSEHCSYKSSKKWLRTLPTKAPWVIQGPGENAGVIDIGDGQAVVFKMESHNHPSFIEPYQGAATGVGGILRDVFTMGARPIANLNALRFGSPDDPRTRHLVAGVVGGIGGYGNCVGVPTVGGETNFHPAYNGNILVNAMTVGLADADRIFYSKASGIGNAVVYVGAKTGRDGIHGATMASAEFSDDSEAKRPTVQVGDPFTEKLLIEACLELMATDAIVAIQDMGAAGLTSSSVEMASKGGLGMDLDLDQVPVRETGMTAYEIMLSESQERMLMVIRPDREAVARKVFEKWELDFAVVGRLTGTGRLVVRKGNLVEADIPLQGIGDSSPEYDRPWVPAPPAPPLDLKLLDRLRSTAGNSSSVGPLMGDTSRGTPTPPSPIEGEGEGLAPQPSPSMGEGWGGGAVRGVASDTPARSPTALLARLMATPNLCSKRWIWEQYDHMVMGDTVERPGGDAAVVRVHGTAKGLALTCDCTPRYCAADPVEGGRQAVAEAWRNLTAVGATPLAVTDNMNFGNPERPEVMGQFVGCIQGIAEACRALDFPVVSGNVSLYNETNGRAILPTPAIGGVGVIRDVARRMSLAVKRSGEAIVLIGATRGHLGASLFAAEILQTEAGAPPPVDLRAERENGDFVRGEIASGAVSACHDISDGGLLVAVAEMALAGDIGGDVRVPDEVDALAWLFGEDQARFLATTADAPGLLDRAAKAGVPASAVGRTGGRSLTVNGRTPISLDELRSVHEGWLPAYMAGRRRE